MQVLWKERGGQRCRQRDMQRDQPKHIMELAYGHGALPRDLYTRLSSACGFPCAAAPTCPQRTRR